jgi:hypothetical protein
VTPREKAENATILYLMHHKSGLYKRIKPLVEQHTDLLAKEDPCMHKEIESQFHNLVRRELANEIAENMFTDPEQTYLVVETMDVPAFIAEASKPVKEVK